MNFSGRAALCVVQSQQRWKHEQVREHEVAGKRQRNKVGEKQEEEQTKSAEARPDGDKFQDVSKESLVRMTA